MQQPGAVVPFLRLRWALDSVLAVVKRPDLSDALPFRRLPVTPLIAMSYYAGSKIGFFLTPSATPLSTFWPANAILLAGFLLVPVRTWWVLLLTLLPVHLLVQLQTGVPVVTALGWFVGNTGEAILGAMCIRLFKKEGQVFESVRGIFTFLVFGVLLAPMASSFVDSASAIRLGEINSYWQLWETRLSTNMLAILSIVPIVVTFGSQGLASLRKTTLERCLEAGALASSVVVLSFFIFSGSSIAAGVPAAFVYVPLLLLLWAAVRFGPVGLSASLLGVALISAWETVRYHRTFGSASAAQDLLSLHILLTVFAFPLMLIAALIAERRNNQETLELTRRALIHAHEQDRQRIARELQTYVAGQLTMAGLGVDELRGVSNSYARPVLERLYEQILSTGNTMLRLTHKIHPFNVEYLGLARALTKLCRDTGAESGVTVSSLVEDVPAQLSLDASLRLFRIAQLALENTVDSHAKSAEVQLLVDARRVLLRIADVRACPNPQGRPAMAGLTYMREQVLSLGGTLEAILVSDGTVIEASIPISLVAPDRKSHSSSNLV